MAYRFYLTWQDFLPYQNYGTDGSTGKRPQQSEQNTAVGMILNKVSRTQFDVGRTVRGEAS